MFRFIVAFISIATFLACKNTQRVSSSYVGKEFITESGLKYTIHKAGKGERAESGDIVSVHYAGRLRDSTEFDNSFKRGEPISFQLGKGMVIPGWEEGIQILNEGDSATFEIPAHLAYGSKQQGLIPANSDLIFEVRLISAKDEVKPWPTKGKDTLEVTSGLKLIKITENPKGEVLSAGMSVELHYSGYMKGDKKFESSVDMGKPIRFTLGQGQVIPGWEMGLHELKEGEKAKLIISPELAYGSEGKNQIPPNATLTFDVEVISVTNPVDEWVAGKRDTTKITEGLKIIRFSENPDGVQVENGKKVEVHYSGFLTNGQKFDSSVDRGQPFSFVVGQGRVIKGWDLGIASLKTGEKAKLIISPEMGYGDRETGPIPANSTLIFDVEVLRVY